MMGGMRIIVGKRSDPDAIAAAIGVIPAERPSILHPSVLTAGILSDLDCVEFAGIDPPDRGAINLASPVPVEGEAEGWIYPDGAEWAAYTRDLVAVRLA